jgi:hypothetical protein
MGTDGHGYEGSFHFSIRTTNRFFLRAARRVLQRRAVTHWEYKRNQPLITRISRMKMEISLSVLLTVFFFASREDFIGTESQLAFNSMVTSSVRLRQIWHKDLSAKK